jgi:hypothetical protein
MPRASPSLASLTITTNDKTEDKVMESSNKWKIGEVIYKFAVVSLLIIAVVLLNDIRSHQAPTIGEHRNAGIGGPDVGGAKAHLEDRIPIVRVVGGEILGGQVTANRNITVDNAVQVKVER